jgi:hypothetical protein
MGQYYIFVILAENGTATNEYIRSYLQPHSYGEGAKLMEHSYVGTNFMNTVETLISPEGMFYKSRLVWAGDYANPEKNLEENIYRLTYDIDRQFTANLTTETSYRYIVNHTRKQYVDKLWCSENSRESDYIIHPLPLLISEGNGSGGGDYRGNNEDFCGSWTRDVISMESEIPDSYTELVCEFQEY